MSEPVLLVDREPPVAILTLNRPEQRNALSSELRLAIGAAFRELEADPEIRAVIVTGAGSAFCAGMDLKEMGSGGEGVTGYELSVAGQFEMREGIEEFSGPVIAAVNGAAATAGFADAPHLNRTVQQYLGLRPSDFANHPDYSVEICLSSRR